MELFMTNEYYVLSDHAFSLWCSRSDGSITARSASELESLTDCVCIGVVHGLIGKFTIHPEIDRRLVLIRERASVGFLPGGHEVFKIQKVALLPLSQQQLPDMDFEVCKKHHFNPRKVDKHGGGSDFQQKAFQKTWNTIRTATAQVKSRKQHKELRDRERLEKRVLDEFSKMFTDTDSFYYSLTGDLTNSMQRQFKQSQKLEADVISLWRKVDDRFFWNKHMLHDLLNTSSGPLTDHWIIPIIQGFVQIEHCWIDIVDDSELLSADGSSQFEVPGLLVDRTGKTYIMIIISRRSRFRAGTRYKRRGVDESGKCANYVETEQIFQFGSHTVSFVQVRGSVPVFWSQPGYKYRPPPRLDRGEEETQVAFEKHFTEEVSHYGSQAIISLVEQCGKEKIIGDAYLNHILSFSCPNLIYVTFDFHEYCRGMKFENVSVLTESIQDIIRDMRYCWTDSQGLICEQRGVFRVNCIDCLDRTNIVQTALAKTVMDIQFIKLGLLPPEGILPAGCRRVFQMLWANNGDIISRQYAGTVALKGDYTRTGERRFTGMMKDGYNSANRTDAVLKNLRSLLNKAECARNTVACFSALIATYEYSHRYYVNRFKDAFRQATIDLMLGNPITDDINAVTPEREDAESEIDASEQEHHERVKQLIEDCKKILIPETEVVLGGWALIDADPVTGDPGQQDMDTILVLTKDSYYIAEYDDQTDRIIKYQRVLLEDLERIELGPEHSLFKAKRHCLRLHYTVNAQSGFFHMFRSTNTRFFNNMAVPICSEEEAAESLKAICEAFKVALSVKSLNVPFFEGKLERRKSKVPLSQAGVRTGVFRSNRDNNGHNSNSGAVGFHLELPSLSSMPRNISEGQLNSLKTVGSRALSNMTSHFAKLNPMRSVKALGRKVGNGTGSCAPSSLASVAEKTSMKAHFSVDSSSDSDEDSMQHQKKIIIGGYPGHVSDRTLSSDYSECSDMDEQEITLSTECLSHTSNSKDKHDAVLESCGILATGISLKTSYENMTFFDDRLQFSQHRYDIDVDDFVLDAMKRAALRQMHRKASCESSGKDRCAKLPPLDCQSAAPQMPQIHISTESNLAAYARPEDVGTSTSKTAVSRKLSKSSEDLDFRPCVLATSNEVSHLLVQEEVMLDTDSLSAKMKTSHSESAIQDFSFPSLNLPNPLSSPIVIKKDLVLSPLSRIAKGVQNLGMNLRPSHRTYGSQTSPDSEEYERAKVRRKSCATRIIEL